MTTLAGDAGLDAARTRSTRTLFVTVSLAAIALYGTFTAGALVASELTGSTSWSGVPGAVAVLGAGVGAGAISRLMAKRGRRTGLVVGYAVAVVGAVTSVLGFEAGSFGVFLAGMVMIGIGHGASQLSRFVAADLQPPARKGTALAWIVWSSTIGAGAGPALMAPMRGPAEALGLPPLAGAFVLALVAYFLAAGLCTWLLRPDPSELAHRDDSVVAESPNGLELSSWRHPVVQSAIVVLLATQAAMVLIMSMTPVHIRDAGHSLDAIGFVMSSHFVGMFALAPVAGKLVDRMGAVRVALMGLGLLIAAASIGALVPASSHMALALALFLLGLGWSLAFVAGSGMLAGELPVAQRMRMQGNVDTLMWTAGATASLSSGLLLEAFSYPTLCVIGGAMVLVAGGLIAPRLPRRAEAAT
ncbi:MAG: MFS transporter [Actinomycetota bacterium]